jgi:anti-sigma-K factor RskA
MDLHRHAGLIDQLAAEYTLGVLRGGARRRFEHISQHDPAIRLAVETWRMRLAAMTEIGPAVAPPPELWSAIERRLNLANARRDAAAVRPAEVAAPTTPTAAPATTSTPTPVQPARPAPSTPSTRPKTSWFENLSFWRGWSIAATAVAAIALVDSCVDDGRAGACDCGSGRAGAAYWLCGYARRPAIERDDARYMGRPDFGSHRAAVEWFIGSLR